jgi:flagellar protein FlbT
VMGGAYYKALVQCRKLFEFEQERLTYDPESIPEYAVHY